MMYYPCPWLEFADRMNNERFDPWYFDEREGVLGTHESLCFRQYWRETEAIYHVGAANSTLMGELLDLMIDVHDEAGI